MSAMNVTCPNCGSEDVVAFIDLRRCYSGNCLSIVDGELMYEGWGDQVGDQLDYLTCDDCDTQFTVQEVLAAATA